MNLDQTFSILFWLNKCKANSKGEAPIYIRITVDGKRAECSTAKTIKPKDWNSRKGLPNSKYYLAQQLTEYLKQVEAAIFKHYNILLTTRDYVTAEDVKRSFRGIKAPEIKIQHKSLLELLDQFISKLEERRNKNDACVGRSKQFKTVRI